MTYIVDLICQFQTNTETIADLKRRLSQFQQLVHSEVSNEKV